MNYQNPRYFVIAGPQAAGKSTLLESLSREHENSMAFLGRTGKTRILRETRDIVAKKYNSKGAIFMTKTQELEVANDDLRRMLELESILEDERVDFCLDECNIFTLAHAKNHGMTTEKLFRDYFLLLKQLHAHIIFLDAPPQVSWQRRKEKYEQRARQNNLVQADYEEEKLMNEYQRYMAAVYPSLLAIYKKIEIPKARFNASLPKQVVLENVRKYIHS